MRQSRPPRLSHCGKSRSLDSSEMRLGLAELSRPPVVPQPRSQPASPALSKKKKTNNNLSSPLRCVSFNSAPSRTRDYRPLFRKLKILIIINLNIFKILLYTKENVAIVWSQFIHMTPEGKLNRIFLAIGYLGNSHLANFIELFN